jgi:hypothetical protein
MSKYRNLNYKVKTYGSQESASAALGIPVTFNPERKFIQEFAFTSDDAVMATWCLVLMAFRSSSKRCLANTRR